MSCTPAHCLWADLAIGSPFFLLILCSLPLIHLTRRKPAAEYSFDHIAVRLDRSEFYFVGINNLLDVHVDMVKESEPRTGRFAEVYQWYTKPVFI